MKLIDPEDLISYRFKNDISYNSFVGLIKRMPTIEAEPVRRGRWIDETVVSGTTSGETTVIKQYRCSVCGNLFGRVDDNFCGRCGAKMEVDG